MDENPDDIDWSLTTWEGSRRAQLRYALAMTVRERLQALEGMGDLMEHFRRMRAAGKFFAVPAAEARAVQQPPAPYGSKVEPAPPDTGKVG